MKLETIRLLFDFGLMVLIWMVQLVVYPSFMRYEPSDLVVWHRLYVGRIALIVIPLMLGQLIISGWQVLQQLSLYNVISFSAVLFLWSFTFTHFAPLHGQISKADFNKTLLQKLVARNWVRTTVWSLLFVYGSIVFLLRT